MNLDEFLKLTVDGARAAISGRYFHHALLMRCGDHAQAEENRGQIIPIVLERVPRDETIDRFRGDMRTVFKGCDALMYAMEINIRADQHVEVLVVLAGDRARTVGEAHRIYRDPSGRVTRMDYMGAGVNESPFADMLVGVFPEETVH